MNPTPSVPPRFARLGEALRPGLDLLERRLDELVYPIHSINDPGSWLQSSIDRLSALVGSVNAQFAQLSNEVLANENAHDADIYRIAGRFDAYLGSFLDGRSDIRRAWVPDEFVFARDLLAGAYRHYLNELHEWLLRFIALLEDPLAAARRQGLPEDGPINLEMTLTFTSAPELAQLSAWAERQRKKNDNSSFWTLIGGIALGALFLDGVIDNDCGGSGGL